MMSCIVFTHFSCLAAADRPTAQRAGASDDSTTNIWMWRCSRGRPLMVSIAEAERISAERQSRTRAAETRKRRSVAAAAAGAAQGGDGADWTLAYDIIGHIIYNFMYYIIGMIYDIIAYDIIVNIIPVISGTLHYLGPWPAFAGQPYTSFIYIPIRSNWIITAVSIWGCCWLGCEGVGSPIRRSRVRVCAHPSWCMAFYFFSRANHIFDMDYGIIGKLWT